MPSPEPSPSQDLALVQRALNGHSDAVRPLAQRLGCVPKLLARINARRGSPLTSHDLEDLGQDALIAIWKKLEKFSGQTTLEGWLYRFCFLEFMNRSRVKGRMPRPMPVELDTLEGGEGASDWPAQEEVEEALRELGYPDEDVIRLRHFENLSFDQAAEALGIPSSTAKTRYYRGIRRLRHRLRGLAPEGHRDER